MRILVCIKQVPGTTQVDIDEKTGVLKRDGVESKINPYDLFAIETALRLKSYWPEATTLVLSMGPPQAEQSLREALMMGIDEAVLVTDRAFVPDPQSIVGRFFPEFERLLLTVLQCPRGIPLDADAAERRVLRAAAPRPKPRSRPRPASA